MRNDVAFIYQPHFNSRCMRVSKADQKGSNINYIIVTCSPEYNGVYSYPTSILNDVQTWDNNRVSCYCIPIKDCKFIQSLESIKTEEIITKIKKQQSKWYNNEIKNRDYTYKEKPEWMLK